MLTNLSLKGRLQHKNKKYLIAGIRMKVPPRIAKTKQIVKYKNIKMFKEKMHPIYLTKRTINKSKIGP